MSARDEAIEMIRRICPPHLSAEWYGEILSQQFDAYAHELAEEIRNFRFTYETRSFFNSLSHAANIIDPEVK